MESAINTAMRKHFSQVARKYQQLRTTDLAPVRFIAATLRSMPSVLAADVGCGTGRYDRLLFEYLGDGLSLHCIDNSEYMLKELDRHLRGGYAGRFTTSVGHADSLPLADRSVDAVFTFNAVHHFPLSAFLEEACRVMKPGASLIIYTRFRSQNARNIWGQYFPRFSEKEDRLYEAEEMAGAVANVSGLALESIVPFRYRRRAGLDRLVEQARGRHYSTFSLYGAEEFEEALWRFERDVRRRFKDPHAINWYDENSMVVVRKA